MKLFTKLGFALLVMLISSSVLWAQSSACDIAPKKQTYTIASEAQFDLQFEWPVGVGGGEAGIECDGINIYTTKWNGADFYRYQLDGTYIESFTVTGASNVRDLAFNGTYFYGGAASTTVFEMDFSAQSLVSSFTAPTDCRAIGYNEDDDVFYANNWGSAITCFDPTGAFVSSWSVGPVGDSYYGFAYDNYSTGAPYLWGYAQVGANLSELIQMELPSGTETGLTFDVGSVLSSVDMAGGLAIDDNLVSGYWTLLGTCQNVNIWGLELCTGVPPLTGDLAGTVTDADGGAPIEGATVILQGTAYSATTITNGTYEILGINVGDYTAECSASGYITGTAPVTIEDGITTTQDFQLTETTTLDPPINVIATATDDDVTVTWEAPGGGGPGEWIQWDNGENASAIGLVSGGTFSVASHWEPADIASYDGYIMSKISFFPNDENATYILKVWIGDGTTEILSQDITSFTVGEWNEVDLDNPVTIDASDDFWFGYETTHIGGTHPAGCASGPAIQGKGDMIYTGGAWESLYVLTGGALDYNWNLAGWVSLVDGETTSAPMVKENALAYNNGSFTAINTGTVKSKAFNPTSSKALLGYNVYRNTDLIGYTTDTTYFDETLPSGTYIYCVSAVYDEGESAQVCAPEVTIVSSLNPPTGLTATFVPDDDIYLDWVAPGGGPTGSILCVDRDGSADLGFSDDWPTIQAALDANGLTYDYFEVADITLDGPDLATMQQYDLIIWFTGEGWQNNQTMTDNDESNLGTFIAGGGNLLLSAQDYLYDRYSSAGSFSAGQFPYDYLGVASTTQDNWSIFAPDLADISGVAGSFAEGITFQVQDIYTSDKEGLYIDQITSLDQDLFEVTNPTPAGIAACQYDGGSFRTAFTTISLAAVTDAGTLATVMGNAVSWLSGGDSDALLGYNVYRDGTNIDYVADPTTEYTDENLAPGTYEYCVTAVYDEGESACSNNASAEVPGGGGCSIFGDDFESYNVGDQLVCVNPDDWTTWSGTPCNNEDPYIVDDGSNVVEITGTNDLVHVMENYTTGFYTMTFDMLVPTGGDGYFNTLQNFAGTSSEWGMQVYFGHTNLGEGNIDAGGALAQMFTFDYDTWMAIKVTVDLDNDWGEFFLDGVLIHGWVWSGGCFGTGTLNQLGGNNFYAWDGGVNANPLYHFDNYCLDVPQEYIFCDDFESYNVGGQLVCQNPDDWTTWSGTPCNNEDPYIIDDGGNKVVEVTGTNDLIYVMENYTSGFYTMTFDMLVPTGGDGYFNTLQEFITTPTWGMQVYFGHTNLGEGNIDAGGALAQMFTFDYDTWMAIKVTVDLDNDWGEFFLDDVLIHGWVWSSGCFGTGTLNQLGGNNFYAWDGGVNANPLYHIDNYCLDGDPPSFPEPQNPVATLFDLVNVNFTWDPPLSGDPNSYNVFKDGTFLVNTTNTEYDDLNLDPGTYEYCVSAVYDGGESIQVCAAPVTVPSSGPPPPTNLQAVEGTNGVDLTWEGIGGAEWIQWDDGENVSAVGLTNGGTFSVASHWEPADLTNYDGFTLSKISFFPSDENATYILKVWTGPSGTTEVLSQDIVTFNFGEWNEVDLDNPVTIDASTDFWFGYETTHLGGSHPAGCAAGPAIQGKGDMILTGGSWESLYVLTGGALDYNWNLAGYVSLSDGIVTPLIGHEVSLTLSGDSFASALESVVTNNQYSKFIPSSTKDLSYNVYFKPEGGSFSPIANTVDTFYTHEEPIIGWNYYYVTSLLDGDESVPSNEDSVLITRIEENIFNNTLVYPNPATDMVNIKSDFEINSVMVYNYAGQIVANEQVNSKFYQINTSQYNAGIYFFRIETDEGTISKRIIVE